MKQSTQRSGRRVLVNYWLVLDYESISMGEYQTVEEAGEEPPNTIASDEGEVGDGEPVKFHEISPALEFMCWVVVALAPMLRLVNGPPVTDDQAIIQITLVTMATCGALGLRLYNWKISK